MMRGLLSSFVIFLCLIPGLSMGVLAWTFFLRARIRMNRALSADILSDRLGIPVIAITKMFGISRLLDRVYVARMPTGFILIGQVEKMHRLIDVDDGAWIIDRGNETIEVIPDAASGIRMLANEIQSRTNVSTVPLGVLPDVAKFPSEMPPAPFIRMHQLSAASSLLPKLLEGRHDSRGEVEEAWRMLQSQSGDRSTGAFESVVRASMYTVASLTLFFAGLILALAGGSWVHAFSRSLGG